MKSTFGASNDNIDMVYMGHCDTACPEGVTTDDYDLGAGVHVMKPKHAFCTHAYLVSYKGAKKVLDLTMPIKHAVDEMMHTAVVKKHVMDSRVVCPAIARQAWQKEAMMWGSSWDRGKLVAHRPL